MTTLDTGERRRSADVRPVITELIDEATVESIAQDAWIALVGEEEVLVPLPGEPVTDPVSSSSVIGWACCTVTRSPPRGAGRAARACRAARRR